jgi:signal transduction histidine kinase
LLPDVQQRWTSIPNLSITVIPYQKKTADIYRIIQELVNNAIKHAKASEIIIQISEEENILNLTVEDNGGFDPALD